MGLFKEKNMGLRCDENDDGSKTCKRYKKKGGEKFGTGTEAQLILDKNKCEVRIVGDINDADRESIEREAQNMENKCRKGF